MPSIAPKRQSPRELFLENTEEEQKLLDEFVKYQENEEEQSVYIDPELLKKAGAV